MTRRLGEPIGDWTAPQAPDFTQLEGRFVTLERLAEAHAADLFRANSASDAIWDYLGYGPFTSEATYHRWVKDMAEKSDPMFFSLRDRATGRFGGVLSLMRIEPAHGCIEVGHINLSPEMQRGPWLTEAIYLLAQRLFGLGYRRFEWKCDSLNLPSRRAAQRFGFSYEGLFRQHFVIKGRNRDTAWFAMTSRDWPCLGAAYEAWLTPANFDAEGRQIDSLGNLTALCLAARDPAL